VLTLDRGGGLWVERSLDMGLKLRSGPLLAFVVIAASAGLGAQMVRAQQGVGCLGINCGEDAEAEMALQDMRSLQWEFRSEIMSFCFGGRCPGETRRQCEERCHSMGEELDEACRGRRPQRGETQREAWRKCLAEAIEWRAQCIRECR
jgi:hypothetical protein